MDGRVLGTTLGDMDGLPLGTYDGLEIVWLEGSTYGNKYDKVDVLLLGSWLLPVDALELCNHEDAKLETHNGKILGKKFGAMLGEVNGIDLELL